MSLDNVIAKIEEELRGKEKVSSWNKVDKHKATRWNRVKKWLLDHKKYEGDMAFKAEIFAWNIYLSVRGSANEFSITWEFLEKLMNEVEREQKRINKIVYGPQEITRAVVRYYNSALYSNLYCIRGKECRENIDNRCPPKIEKCVTPPVDTPAIGHRWINVMTPEMFQYRGLEGSLSDEEQTEIGRRLQEGSYEFEFLPYKCKDNFDFAHKVPDDIDLSQVDLTEIIQSTGMNHFAHVDNAIVVLYNDSMPVNKMAKPTLMDAIYDTILIIENGAGCSCGAAVHLISGDNRWGQAVHCCHEGKAKHRYYHKRKKQVYGAVFDKAKFLTIVRNFFE